MKVSVSVLIALGVVIAGAPEATAASKHNGACMGFAGSIGGQNYAGLKCKVDEMAGAWVIRHTVKERDNQKQYRELLRWPRRPVPCTLKKASELEYHGAINVVWDIKACG